MSKNIVVCSDGTGNADISGRGTNVFKLFEAVELRANQKDDAGKCPQIAIYHDGVGTESFKPLKILGGAFGLGFSRHVRELYTELSRVYEPGDKIFLFGFSRGAFTVRTLSGLINRIGVLDVQKLHDDAQLRSVVNEGYAAYRRTYRRFSSFRKSPVDHAPGNAFRKKWAVEDITPIEFVGVWDTVDAVGFPVDAIAETWNQVVYPFRFPDRNISSNVRCGRHAIAIDDERRTFHPELWNESEQTETNGRIRQVWFSGVHSNVGGGYPKQGLSLITLTWMMNEAAEKGLRFVPTARAAFSELQNPYDKLYDSRAGLAGYYAYQPRDVELICEAHNAKPRLHISVAERISQGTNGYAPGNLARGSVIVAEDAATDVSKVQREFGEVLARKDKLSGARFWNGLWRLSQALFVIASVAAVGFYLYEYGMDGVKALTGFDGYYKLGRLAVWEKPWIAAVLAVTYALCYLASNRLGHMYSEYWFKHRRPLREALDECSH